MAFRTSVVGVGWWKCNYTLVQENNVCGDNRHYASWMDGDGAGDDGDARCEEEGTYSSERLVRPVKRPERGGGQGR